MKESDPDKPNLIPVAELFMTRYAGVLQEILDFPPVTGNLFFL